MRGVKDLLWIKRLSRAIALVAALVGGHWSIPARAQEYRFPEVNRAELDANVSPEVHGIATHFGGPLAVFVGAAAKPRILHLTSQEIAYWRVYLRPGSQVRQIYVSGFAAHKVVVVKVRAEEPGPEVVDLGLNLQGHETLSFGPPTSIDARQFSAYRDEVEKVTGFPLTHYQGAESLRAYSAFAIGDVPVDIEQLMRDFPPATEARQLQGAAAIGADEELDRALADLRLLIDARKLPARLPEYSAVWGPAPDELLYWSPVDMGSTAPLPPEPRHDRREKRCDFVELGSPQDDVFYCGTGFGDRSTRFVFAGGGADMVSDTHYLSQVVSGGPGDDVIELDVGNDVVFFSAGWGEDVVNFRCNSAEIEAFRGGLGWIEPPGPFATPEHQRSSYVVFGRGINPRDLVWATDRLLTHPPSGSSIFFDDGLCATMLAVEEGPLPPSPEATEALD